MSQTRLQWDDVALLDVEVGNCLLTSSLHRLYKLLCFQLVLMPPSGQQSINAALNRHISWIDGEKCERSFVSTESDAKRTKMWLATDWLEQITPSTPDRHEHTVRLTDGKRIIR